jgi:hypothetical protein
MELILFRETSCREGINRTIAIKRLNLETERGKSISKKPFDLTRIIFCYYSRVLLYSLKFNLVKQIPLIP